MKTNAALPALPALATLASLGALAALSACSGSPTEPTLASEVLITLHVTGGIAAADYEFTLDGKRSAFVGGPCTRLCDWTDGDVLGEIPEAQVLQLARRFVRSGLLDLEPGDYGDECCDQFHYRILYRDRDDGLMVEGAGARLPVAARDAADALQRAMALASGRTVLTEPE